MLYQSAQRTRGSYQDTADLVAKLGTLAGDAFNSTEEIVAFAEQINMQFALAGTSAQGAQAAILQLTQAMSSGVLRGEELNSILEQAPTITASIADYLDVSIGEMRQLASEGLITAEVVKAAVFDAAGETSTAFTNVPLTFSQAADMAGNAALMNVFLVPGQNMLAAFGNFIGNFLNDPLAAVKMLFLETAQSTLGHISSMAHGIEDLINAIPGMSVNLTSKIDAVYSISGDDEETDDALRTRLITALNDRSFGGNVAEYRENILSMDGVGAAGPKNSLDRACL